MERDQSSMEQCSADHRLLATSVARHSHLHRYSERMDAEIMLAWTLAMIRGARPADILRMIERFR